MDRAKTSAGFPFTEGKPGTGSFA